MCLTDNSVANLSSWNWDGDMIIPDSVVPSSRPVVGYKSNRNYKIDIREFLTSENNALIHDTLNEEIIAFIKNEMKGDVNQFKSRKPNSFDYRAYVIRSFVSEKIAYSDKVKLDPWQFPDETLFIKTGDCEDRAFLIASLLIASGISSYNVRVALGKVIISDDEKQHEFDHMWVMYKSEIGKWILIEPLICSGTMKTNTIIEQHRGKEYYYQGNPNISADYIPYFLFNNCHLWGVLAQGRSMDFENHLVLYKSFSKFNPKFAGEVHKSILQAALSNAPVEVQKQIDRYYSKAFIVFGPPVDKFDRGTYNPYVHCDNCYIQEGWDLIKQNLGKFKLENNLDAFFEAAHTIADFYAHSSYVHFAKIKQLDGNPNNEYAELFNIENPQFELNPIYSPIQDVKDFDLTGTNKKFTVNQNLWNGPDKNLIASTWKTKIISGRYAQKGDTWKGLESFVTEGILSVIPEKLENAPDFKERGWVPHHNEIAVDEAQKSSAHILYSENTKEPADRGSYKNQFKWRRNAAINHIRQVFSENYSSNNGN